MHLPYKHTIHDGIRVPSSIDEILLLRIKNGDETAFGELYALHRARVYRFAVKLLRDRDQAEDITQETFLKARRAIEDLGSGHSMLSWLFAIARNEVYTLLRKTRGNGKADVDELWESETPLDTVIGAETAEAVQRTIDQLKPSYREVILLREYEHLSYAEISKVTGDTESSIKARLFKARKALVNKLKPLLGEET